LIDRITDEEGHTWSDPDDVGQALSRVSLFLYTSLGSVDMSPCISAIPTKVCSEMNRILLRNYSPEEVDTALSQMQALKAPRLDGYGVCFYQKHWNMVGEEVRKAILNFGIFDPSINYTYNKPV
jgi:hypothetical protein